ncbi:MAG: GntR family transcriptional regulator [Clostridia bacterium]|nr:GntR family transcriptional regulator [Oscillospiraceae bacterium]MBQ7075700.1 GntR family transcriptional regulator [Clostridia bacterium]
MIQINHKDSRSLHIQIEDGIKDLIINKVLAENQQLPSVRELSIELTVNPNTVQRAYRELEQSGFIYSIRGKGNFVSPVQDVADEKKISELYDSFESVVKSLFFLGEDEEKIISFIKNIKEESK